MWDNSIRGDLAFHFDWVWPVSREIEIGTMANETDSWEALWRLPSSINAHASLPIRKSTDATARWDLSIMAMQILPIVSSCLEVMRDDQ